MKSSYPGEFHQIPRQYDFHVFRDGGCPVNPKNEIFEENLGNCKLI